MAAKKPADDVKVLFPERKIKIQNEDITIRPFKFGQLPQVMKGLEKVGGSLIEIMSGDTIDPSALIRLIGDGSTDLMELACLAVNKDVDWFEQLEMDEGVEVIANVLEVNSSFFVERVLPKVNTAMEAINPSQDGAQSSSD